MKKLISIAFFVISGAIAVSAQELPEILPVPFNNPEISTDLGVGLWAYPIPYDLDADGVTDLIISCPCTPYRGTYYFKNIGTVKEPFFDKAVKLSPKASKFLCSAEYEGETVVMDMNYKVPDYFKDPDSQRYKVKYKGPGIIEDIKKYRSYTWIPVDWDNDGDTDYIAGVDSLDDYGWDDAYDEKGRWTNGPIHGWVYLIENREGQLYNTGRIQAGGEDIDVFGYPNPCVADFDGDGDLDIICGEFIDGLTWYENVSTRAEPMFAKGRPLHNSSGEIKMHIAMIIPRTCDFDKDGLPDLIVGDEDGRVALIRNTGKVRKHMPVFESPGYFRQKSDLLKFGVLSTPVAIDWDGDGYQDLVCGNSAGEIAFIKNLTGGDSPSWAEPQLMKVRGKPIHIQAGYNGSIQGPAEEKWGYTVLSVADWDGDGLEDLIVNSIWGQIVWYRNLGKKDGLTFAPAKPVKVTWEGETPKPEWNWWKPKAHTLVTQWRTTPVATDLNRDGILDLVVLDTEGYLSFFEGFTGARGETMLKPGQRIFWGVNGSVYQNKKGMIDPTPGALRLNSLTAGKSGRRKICFTDWDLDGKQDLIVDGTNAVWFRNVSENGDGLFKLEYMGDMASTILEGHTTSPTPIDWDNDGICDILLGAEDGFFYLIKNPHRESAKTYSIVILGDTHYDTEPASVYHSDYKADEDEYHVLMHRKEFARNGEMWRERCPRMVERASRLITPDTEMVFQMGDLIQGDCDNPETHIKMLDDALNKFKTQLGGLPFITVEGNHDVRGEGARKAYHTYMPQAMSRELGKEITKTTFGFTIGPDSYIFVDFNHPDTDEIKRLLKEAENARYTFVVSHGTEFPIDNRSARWMLFGDEKDTALRQEFRKLFAERNVIFLCGHTHRIELYDWFGDGGRITQMTMNSVWANDGLAKVDTVSTDIRTYGELRNKEKNIDGSAVTDEKAFFDEYRDGLKRYLLAKGAGSFKMNVSRKGVEIDFYGGDSEEITEKFIIRYNNSP